MWATMSFRTFSPASGRCGVVDGKPIIFLGAVAVVAFDGVLREVFDRIIAELGLVVGLCRGFDGVHFLSGAGEDIDRDG